MFSYVLPTRNRPDRLRKTLLALEALGPHPANTEVLIADNASDDFPFLPRTLNNGLPIHILRRSSNEGAAARNAAVLASNPANPWIVMLDDDSYPINLNFVDVLQAAAPDVAAISADIFLAQPPSLPRRESGGLPEVFTGCGVAIRRDAFLTAGGYDPSFNYYVEEYDLAAKLLLAGHRIAFEPSFQIHHAKDQSHRDFNQIVARLVRNNSWVAQRYAPSHERLPMLRETRRRYRQIAEAEESLQGFARGLSELRRTLRTQPRTPMPQVLFDRFTGLAAAREALQSAYDASPFHTAHLCDIGKNAHVVAQALNELGVRITSDDEEAQVQVIATLSPGPMLDALAKRRAMQRPHSLRTIAPWLLSTFRLRLDASMPNASMPSSQSSTSLPIRRAG